MFAARSVGLGEEPRTRIVFSFCAGVAFSVRAVACSAGCSVGGGREKTWAGAVVEEEALGAFVFHTVVELFFNFALELRASEDV